MEDAQRTMAKVMLHMKEVQNSLKRKQRQESVHHGLEKAGEGTKRNVIHNRKLFFKIEDGLDILQKDDDKPFVTKDNIEEANLAIEGVRQLFVEMQSQIQTEINMQMVASMSALRWNTVKAMEGGMDFPEWVTVDNAEVRKAEKESMAYERDIRNINHSKFQISKISNITGGCVSGELDATTSTHPKSEVSYFKNI